VTPSRRCSFLTSPVFHPTALPLPRPTGFRLNSLGNPRRSPRTEAGLARSRPLVGSITAATQEVASPPDMKVSIRQLFGFDSDMEVPAYSEADEHVPDIDPDYRFDKPTTLAILAGFAHN